jgi:hypothetical protein
MQVPPLDRVPCRSEVVFPPLDSPFQAPGYRSVQPVSISLPASPIGFGFGVPAIPAPANAADSDDDGLQANAAAGEPQQAPAQAPTPTPPPARENGGGGVRFMHQPDKLVFRSQPIPGGQPQRAGSRAARACRAISRDRRYDTFKTFSGKLERQLTHLAGAPEVQEVRGDDAVEDATSRTTSMPKVDRFFAALEGPELDKLKV